MPRRKKPAQRPDWAVALQTRRAALQKSQEQMAAEANMSQSYYNELETGTREMPSLSHAMLRRFASAFDWTLLELEEATKVDLGIGLPAQARFTVSAAPNRYPIYALESLVNPERAEPLSFPVELNPRFYENNYAMRLFFHENAVFLVDASEDALILAQNKEYIFIDNGQVFIGKYQKISDLGLFSASDGGKIILVTGAQVIGRIRLKIPIEFYDDFKN